MFRTLMKKSHLLLVLAALFATVACGGRVYLAESRPLEREIVVDGDADDWLGALSFVEEERLSVGFLNDNDNLYVCLILEQDRAPGLVMMQGLTVWFDPAGGKEKALGIRYPLGGQPVGRSMPRMMEDPQERQENRPFDNLNELEIIKSDKELPEKKTLNQARKEGLDVQVKFSRDSFVYELKIPLLALESQPLAIGVPPKAAIGVGFETGELDSSRMMRPPGGIGGGGMPPMGGRMGGMGGGRGFGMRSQMLKPMKIWVKVQLVQSGGISQPVFLFINDKSCAETDK